MMEALCEATCDSDGEEIDDFVPEHINNLPQPDDKALRGRNGPDLELEGAYNKWKSLVVKNPPPPSGYNPMDSRARYEKYSRCNKGRQPIASTFGGRMTFLFVREALCQLSGFVAFCLYLLLPLLMD